MKLSTLYKKFEKLQIQIQEEAERQVQEICNKYNCEFSSYLGRINGNRYEDMTAKEKKIYDKIAIIIDTYQDKTNLGWDRQITFYPNKPTNIAQYFAHKKKKIN